MLARAHRPRPVHARSDAYHVMALAGIENKPELKGLDRAAFERAPAGGLRGRARVVPLCRGVGGYVGVGVWVGARTTGGRAWGGGAGAHASACAAGASAPAPPRHSLWPTPHAVRARCARTGAMRALLRHLKATYGGAAAYMEHIGFGRDKQRRMAELLAREGGAR